MLSSFPLDTDIPDDIAFPYNFPFSSMVPTVYQQVKEFIYACLKFSEDLNLRCIGVKADLVYFIFKSFCMLQSSRG